MGVAEHCGDTLTYHILTNENKVISRSVLRPITVEDPNLCVDVGDNRKEPTDENRMKENHILQTGVDLTGSNVTPSINPKVLIGFTFPHRHDNLVQKAKVKGPTDSSHTQYVIEFINGGEDIMD